MTAETKSFFDLVTLTRASTATYVAADGTIKTAAVDEKRLDFSTGKKALLLENSATRLNGYVSVRSAWASVVGDAVLTDLSETALGQFGGMSIASPGINHARAATNVVVTAGQTYAAKFLWKPGTSGAVRFSFRLPGAAVESVFAGPSGSLTLRSNGAGAVTLYADRALGAYRETVLLFTAGADDTCQVAIGPDSAVVGETVHAYAWQIEAGSGDTSWILGDTGLAVTRATDLVAPIDISGFYLGSGYTFVVKGRLDVAVNDFDRILQIDNGSDDNRHLFYYGKPGQTISFWASYDGVKQASYYEDAALPTPFTSALAVGPDHFQASVNGGASDLDTDADYMAPTTLRISRDANGGNRAGRLLLESVLIYPGLLTEAKLIEVTA